MFDEAGSTTAGVDEKAGGPAVSLSYNCVSCTFLDKVTDVVLLFHPNIHHSVIQ